MSTPFIFDAHLDLSMNAMEWNRDLRLPVLELREREQGMNDTPDRGKGTVALPEMRSGNIGLCVATQIARYVKKGSSLPGWQSQAQAWAQTQGQLNWYREMEACGEMVQITDVEGLKRHLELWKSNKTSEKPVGYVLSLEGADSIVSMGHLEKSYQQGLRALGPAHYGPGVYAFGTDSEGPLGPKGKELLKKMEELGIILDVTHLCDTCFWEAMDQYSGALWASHNNCRALVNHNRQFSDEQLKEIIGRGGVIGVALDAWMMVPNWQRGVSTPEGMGVGLEKALDHMDHICQLAGNCEHVGIGTDLDGAFGKEQSPYDLDTIADLQKLPPLLEKRGYSNQDMERILSKNFLSFLERVWQ